MKRPPQFVLAISLVLVLAARIEPAAAIENDARHTAALSITSAEVKEHVGALADDTFEGRESGSRGARAAGIYIIERLKKAGLRGGGPKQSFYQTSGVYHNILGLVEGRDPAVKDQVIVISAHYDHVGYGTSRNSLGPVGLIHNGADDNASGVAALLEVADAVGQLPEKPKRSILFAFWDGEERGLIGSQYWIDHPTVPLDHVPIMINADMVGRLRNERVVVFGTRTSQGLRRLISRQNDATRLLLDFTWQMKPDSDHHTFYTHDIPVVMLHTGLHGDYHRPSDDADKINNEGLSQVARLMFNVLVELAEAPRLAGFRRQARQESVSEQQQSERTLPPPPSRLGVRWDARQAEAGRIVVTGATRGSAAEKAGLRAGDRIVEFAGKEVRDAAQFRAGVLAARSPVPAKIERPGQDEPLDVMLELNGEPVRLGISWRSDEAESGTVIVNRLTPGSPADLAGLRLNDRIQRIGGQDFATGEEFRRLATTMPGTLVLDVETAGRVRTVEIPPPAGDDDGGAQQKDVAPPSGDATSSDSSTP